MASFARFSLELMALGAPPELLLGSSQAQADEIAHAQTATGYALVGLLYGSQNSHSSYRRIATAMDELIETLGGSDSLPIFCP